MSQPSLHTVQLQDWLKRIRAGDLAAREELLRSVAGRLEALAGQMLQRFPTVRRWADTEDVLQNALMRLLRSLETVDVSSTRDFYGLAATQIRRELLDLARHFRGPLNAAAHHHSRGGDVPSSPELESSSMDVQQWEAFHEAVEKLPAEEREVVALIFYHGWTQAEVAELFQVNLRTIRRRWQAALLKLHDVVRDLLPAE